MNQSLGHLSSNRLKTKFSCQFTAVEMNLHQIIPDMAQVDLRHQ